MLFLVLRQPGVGRIGRAAAQRSASSPHSTEFSHRPDQIGAYPVDLRTPTASCKRITGPIPRGFFTRKAANPLEISATDQTPASQRRICRSKPSKMETLRRIDGDPPEPLHMQYIYTHKQKQAMIIKRETKSRMPNLQRCQTVATAFSIGDEDGGGEAGDGCRKRRRESGGFHPLEMLGGAAAVRSSLAEEDCCPPQVFVDDDHEDFSSVAAPASSRCSEVSICSGEVESESRIGPRREEDVDRAAGDEEAPAGAAGPRPPVVKTSRGRVQVLPSRFNDSVLLDPWKKEKQKSKALNAGPCGVEEPLMAKEAFGPKLIPRRETPIFWDCRGNVSMKGSTSRSTLTSLHEAALGMQIRPQKRKMKAEPQERLEPMLRERWLSEEHPERRKDFYFLEDFVCGDIVWAKSGKSKQDYAWVRQGSIFPFVDYLDRFQGQTQLHKSKPSDFRMAIEEAFLAEHGFMAMQMEERNIAGQPVYSHHVQEATDSNQDLDCQSHAQAIKKSKLHCQSCGSGLPFKSTKKLLKSKQYCGICKKIWHHTDGGRWVRCDGCKVWVHAECDKICSSHFKDLEKTDYFCPECKAKSNFESSDTEKKPLQRRHDDVDTQDSQPEMVAVCCYGMEGIYLPRQHLVVCQCGVCGTEKRSLSEWERHTGSRSKNWKTSVKVKDSMQPLEKWIEENRTFEWIIGAKRPSPKVRKQKLLDFLNDIYYHFALCLDEFMGHNQLIAMISHQQEGGALKPTDVDGLWVHVTCAWFQPEVSFPSDELMEPAMGILNIPSQSFVKTCVVCKQVHGSCTQCYRCSTYYHAMCASRAGYRMELHCSEKNGRQTTKMVSYCAHHRAPNPDTVLVIQSPLGVFSTKSMLQNKEKRTCSRSIRKDTEHQLAVPAHNSDASSSSARCRVYGKMDIKVCCVLITSSRRTTTCSTPMKARSARFPASAEPRTAASS
ncbi:unnamed protein product [Spirodela intermedia]|uniref:Uncharacterized protein n=1 Tax=Spirodela intermedia TaxID=51605 RepID=A0A7I8ITC5_SPIIN|nr:unnamed protein product [Spirodela intermedia]CAA6661056.1 unnamed protein product [Spirodela intermedia]